MAKKIERLDRQLYEGELARLQAELVKLQEWVRAVISARSSSGCWWRTGSGAS